MRSNPSCTAGAFVRVAIALVFLQGGCSMNQDRAKQSPPAPTAPPAKTAQEPQMQSPPVPANPTEATSTKTTAEQPHKPALQLATFGSGCFWCTEAVFQQLKGVESVVSGYSGGTMDKPTYDDVCLGTTGHAEVIQVTYDPGVVSYPELLEVFWKTHDPTTPNQQGVDVGTQYRSVVFYHNDEQKRLAEKYKGELDAAGVFAAPIVTEISPLKNFFAAEDYHQNFYNANRGNGYCRVMIGPKLEKLRKVFADKVKK
jgi:peptide-methionine (S)-S-oxide reductase